MISWQCATAWSFNKSFCFIGENYERDFDPVIVNAFVENVERIKAVYDNLADR